MDKRVNLDEVVEAVELRTALSKNNKPYKYIALVLADDQEIRLFTDGGYIALLEAHLMQLQAKSQVK